MPLLLNTAAMPVDDPIANVRRHGQFGPRETDPLEGHIGPPWLNFWTTALGQLQQGPTRVAVAPITGGSGSILPTDVSGGTLSAGLYRMTFYAAVTQAATVSSSLTVTFHWTENAIPKSHTFPAMTGNTIATTDSGTYTMNVDGNAPIAYSTVYASVGATPMLYSLFIPLEVLAS